MDLVEESGPTGRRSRSLKAYRELRRGPVVENMLMEKEDELQEKEKLPVEIWLVRKDLWIFKRR